VPVFGCPADSRAAVAQVSPADGLTVGLTSYLGVCGTDCLGARGGLLFTNSAVRFADVTDGLSNTLLLGERPPGPDFLLGRWYAGLGQIVRGAATGSAEMILGVREPNAEPVVSGSPCGPGVHRFNPAGGVADPCGVYHFWSSHPGGANFALADGSVRLLPYTADDRLPALATRAGGEAADAEK
jgi:prepilin-type processing-associated H-X9-DG protein